MRVNHRRVEILVPEQFLNRADVPTGFEQVRGETVTERMGRHPFRNICARNDGGNFSRDGRFMQVLPTPNAAARVGPDHRSGTMKQDEAANPTDVGAFGPQAVMVDAQDFDDAVVQPWSRFSREQPQRFG